MASKLSRTSNVISGQDRNAEQDFEQFPKVLISDQISSNSFQCQYSTEAKISLASPQKCYSGWKDINNSDQKISNYKTDIESQVNAVTSELLEEKIKKENKYEKINTAAAGAEYKKNNKKKPFKFKEKFSYANPSISMIESFVLLVSLGLLPQAYSMPMNQDIFTYDLLITNQCSRRNFDRSQSCQLSGYQLADTIQHCGFQAMCKPGYKAKCVNTLQGGMAHICVSENMSCSEGILRKAWIDKDNPDLVRVQEEKCPSGTFQSYEINCFDACNEIHLDTNDIPEWYVLYNIGDNISPTYVYCNYKKGFFNMENKTFLNYDQDSKHLPYFCSHVGDIDHFCIETKYPLPNGTCVSDCIPGECRDDHDDFICKRNCGNEASDNEEDSNYGHRNENNKCPKNKHICKNGSCQSTPDGYICECPEGFTLDRKTEDCIETQKKGIVTEKGTTHDENVDNKVLMIILLSTIIPGCLLIGIITAILVFKRQSKSVLRQCCPGGSNVPAVDDPSQTSLCGADDSRPSSSSESTVSQDKKSANDNSSHRCNMTESTCDNSLNVKFNDANTVEIHYHTYETESDNHNSKKKNRKAYSNTCKGNFDLSKENGHTGHFEIDNVDGQAMAAPKTRSHEVKDREPVCQDDATTPLLYTGAEYVETELQDQEEKSHQVGIGNVRKGFERERLKKDIDDTFTQSSMRSLTNSMESCGVLIHSGNVAGTAFRVGSKYVMTAFHVIQSMLIYQTGDNGFDFSLIENCRDVFVNFAESVCTSCQTFKIKVIYFKEEIDVAVLELVDFTGNIPPALILCNSALLGCNSVSVAGFGHINSPYEKRCENCPILKNQQAEDRLRAAQAWLEDNRQGFITDIKRNGKDHTSVDRGYIGYDNENIIKFDCFMGKGLSGGPVLSNEEHSVKVIGMVIGGKPELYYNLSPEKQDSFPKIYMYEFAVKMHLILSTIRLEDPELARDILSVEA